MKVIDTVKKSFFEYPTLYAFKKFEDIQFNVLHQYFIILGNGLEWANTKDKSKGGYLTDPKIFKKHGEWTRKIDLPYGKEKVNIDIEPYLSNTIYDLRIIDHEQTKRYSKLLKNSIQSNFLNKEGNKKEKRIYLEEDFKNVPLKTLLPGDKYNENYIYTLVEINPDENIDKVCGHRTSPYPNFQKEYSCFYEEGFQYIQDDWKEAALEHLIYWQNWFNDSEKIKLYHRHPVYTKSKDQDLLNTLKKQVKDGQSLKSVCKNYWFKEFDLNDKGAYQNAIKERWINEEKKIKSFLSKTIKTLR